MAAVSIGSPRIYKPALAAVAAVVATLALTASAHANTFLDQNSCVHYGYASQVRLYFPPYYRSVTPGTRVTYWLYRYTSAGWRYSGQWNTLTAVANYSSSTGVSWRYASGDYMTYPSFSFDVPAGSGYYYVATQVAVGGVASPVTNITAYDNWVGMSETGWTSYCQS